MLAAEYKLVYSCSSAGTAQVLIGLVVSEKNLN